LLKFDDHFLDILIVSYVWEREALEGG